MQQGITWTNHDPVHLFMYASFGLNMFWYSTIELSCFFSLNIEGNNPDSKVRGANMGPIWGRQDPGGPHVGHMDLAIWESVLTIYHTVSYIIWHESQIT